jgi:hypothetical protein
VSAFDNAKKFFDACETPLGWDGCRDYCVDGASFDAQSEPLVDVKTIEDYANWMHGFGTVTSKGSTYTLHSQSWDDDSSTAIFFATYHAKHVGDGGPVPPTGQSVDSHYVYAVKMNDDGKVESMTKIWNAPWAMRGLGWID